jgi:hypothetical protein
MTWMSSSIFKFPRPKFHLPKNSHQQVSKTKMNKNQHVFQHIKRKTKNRVLIHDFQNINRYIKEFVTTSGIMGK